MRKIIIPSMLVCTLLGAQDNFIQLGAGYLNEKDNFSSESKKTINSYDSAKSQSEVIADISFYYGKNIDDSIKLYAGSEFGAFVLGSEIETNTGVFDLGLKGGVDEGWENPFLLNSDRKKSDIGELGLYMGWGIPLSKGIFTSFGYEYSEVEYDKDSVHTDLKRDGKKHIVYLENMIEIDKDKEFILTPFYEKYDAVGDASSYKTGGLQALYLNRFDSNIELALSANFAKKEFDKINPVLNKKIDATLSGIVVSIKFNDPFELKNYYISLTTGYEKEDANHNFYDKHTTYGILGIGYKF